MPFRLCGFLPQCYGSGSISSLWCKEKKGNDFRPMAAPPDPDQLVEVRRRQFVVTDVVPSALPPDPLKTRPDSQRQHLVKLSSVEEDALGDELQVVWELEPGARVHDKVLLPTPAGFDAPARLDAFLDAVRWGTIESADSSALQSPFRSGITIEDYQLDPVVRALQMPRVNLLIADDVGLGKTIEAGLVAQELILRHRVRTILIVCPASLLIKWRDEMRDKFGLEFRIVDSSLMKELRRRRGIRVNPWSHFPRLITSIDFLKRERPLRLFRECLPAPGEPIYPRKFDLMIVDEAHNVAPAGSGRYATDSQRTLAIRTLAPHFEHKLFLTATPHNGYKESFSALLELLDDQRFARDVAPDPKQLEAVMVHRLKTEIEKWDGTKRFQERKLEPIEIAYPDSERKAHAKLRRYAELRQSAASEASQRVATEFVLKLLKKRLFSSPAAFLATLEEHEKTLRGLRERKQRGGRKPRADILRRELEGIEEEWADDETYEEASGEAVGTATGVFEELADEERRLIRELKDWARQSSARTDAKAKKLVSWLNETLRPNGDWNDERVIVFTEYRATQKWLQERFATEGLASGKRLETIYGGMEADEREPIKAAFQADPKTAPVRILLATDAASEGIDLQNWCHRVVHYEIPWNPNRLEQRNGRVDRHGQRHQPLIYHFVGEGWGEKTNTADLRAGDLEGDLEFLWHAARKVNQIREDLGKVGPVIASQVEEAMLGRRKGLNTSQAEEEAKPVRRMLRFERDLRDRIAKLHERLHESKRELRVSPENVRSVVEIGLELAGQPRLREASLEGIWPDPTGKRTECPVFHLPPLRGSWARCAEGIPHPYTQAIRPIVFDHDLAAGRDDVVLVHLGHRLVQMCQRLLRAEVWAAEETRKLQRVVARIVPNEALETPAVVAHGRLLVLGGTDYRLHEEVVTAGGSLREGRFSRLNVGQTAAAIDAATDRAAPAVSERHIQDLWPRIEPAVMAALQARANERTKGLARAIQQKAEREVSDLEAVMGELERSIHEELDAKPAAQLDLFTRDEREQLERNRQSLRARLESIPGELERELRQVRARYEDPTPRLFPVALTFLIPERLAR